MLDGTDQPPNYDQDEMGMLAFVLVNNDWFPFMLQLKYGLNIICIHFKYYSNIHNIIYSFLNTQLNVYMQIPSTGIWNNI